MNSQSDYPCPCCGFETFSEPPGSYEICSICGWEDDHVQLRHPDMGGGANRDSLLEAQTQALQLHPVGIQIARGFKRDGKWRPLQESDLHSASAPTSGSQYFDAAAEESIAYYWKR